MRNWGGEDGLLYPGCFCYKMNVFISSWSLPNWACTSGRGIVWNIYKMWCKRYIFTWTILPALDTEVWLFFFWIVVKAFPHCMNFYYMKEYHLFIYYLFCKLLFIFGVITYIGFRLRCTYFFWLNKCKDPPIPLKNMGGMGNPNSTNTWRYLVQYKTMI